MLQETVRPTPFLPPLPLQKEKKKLKRMFNLTVTTNETVRFQSSAIESV